MRSWISFPALVVLALVAVPAHADELTLTLDSYIGYGATNPNPPDLDNCPPPNCVLFTGTLTDNDVDPQPDVYPSFLQIGTPSTDAADMITFDGILALDPNIAPAYGYLSGDANAADLNPPTTESGPVFGVVIPETAVPGVYVDTVNLVITPYTFSAIDDTYEFGNPFTVSAQVTVDVDITPEPSALSCLFAGLAALAAWCGVKRKWPSFEASR
jgi:hypothetical protein